MKLAHLIIVSCVVVFASPAFGQKFLSKPYTEWNVDEVKKVLYEAPWSNQYQSDRGLAAASMEQAARESGDNRISGANRGNLGRGDIPVPIVIQLYSALPVRQAFVRGWQIAAKYDKMNPEDKAIFDGSKASTLKCPLCVDYYIVKLSKLPNSSDRIEDGLFQRMTLDDFKGKIWLSNDKGERLEVFQFTPSKGANDASVFFFKRNREDGTPFFSPADKEIRFNFAPELRAPNSNAYFGLIPESFEFKVAKLVVDGKLAF